jgi:hypothetical protein
LFQQDSTRFLAQDGSFVSFLQGKLKTHTERVRAAYVAPGCRTRAHRFGFSQGAARWCELAEGNPNTARDVNWRGPFHAIEAQHDYASVLASNEALVVAALIAIYIRGEAIATMAAELGASRFRINREIKKLPLKFSRKSTTRAA